MSLIEHYTGQISEKAIGAAIEVHRQLGPGLLRVQLSCLPVPGAGTQRHSTSQRGCLTSRIQGIADRKGLRN